ncbi:hypothetical protein CBR_g19979 [Chara braunii]|uniref:Uncharacterized protein n=1 Tax=Chara braunii TaxID=69332 RepID=A0A388KZ65_CHABU|nr:hypothetical protein CBR_g19979 [Chara braunii]|eukprot:GBG75346.1 hypothetical protein CBR_g19979 [Chara braunii]
MSDAGLPSSSGGGGKKLKKIGGGRVEIKELEGGAGRGGGRRGVGETGGGVGRGVREPAGGLGRGVREAGGGGGRGGVRETGGGGGRGVKETTGGVRREEGGGGEIGEVREAGGGGGRGRVRETGGGGGRGVRETGGGRGREVKKTTGGVRRERVRETGGGVGRGRGGRGANNLPQRNKIEREKMPPTRRCEEEEEEKEEEEEVDNEKEERSGDSLTPAQLANRAYTTMTSLKKAVNETSGMVKDLEGKWKEEVNGECEMIDGKSVALVGRKISDALGDLVIGNGEAGPPNDKARLYWRLCFQIPLRHDEEGPWYKEVNAVRADAMRKVIQGALNPRLSGDRKPVIAILRLMDKKFYEELEQMQVADGYLVGYEERAGACNIEERVRALNRSHEKEIGLHATVCVGLVGGVRCGKEYIILSEHRDIGRARSDGTTHRLVAMNLEEFAIRACEIWEPVVCREFNFEDMEYIVPPTFSDVEGGIPFDREGEYERRRSVGGENPSEIHNRGQVMKRGG